MEFRETFAAVYPRLQNRHEGQSVVIARASDGEELRAFWWRAQAVPSIGAPTSIHLHINLPGTPPGARHHAWLARSEDDGTVTGGTGGMSPDWLSLPRVSFRQLNDGLRLEVSYGRQDSQSKDYAWV